MELAEPDDFDPDAVEAECSVWWATANGHSVEFAAKLAGIDIITAARYAEACPPNWIEMWKEREAFDLINVTRVKGKFAPRKEG